MSDTTPCQPAAKEEATKEEEFVTEDASTREEESAKTGEEMKEEATKEEEAKAQKEQAHRRLHGHLTEADQEVLQAWANASNYAQLLDLNRQLLCDQIPFSCYHMGPIYAETHLLVPGLLNLHDFGILTIESQPSKINDPGLGQCRRCVKEWWFQTQHRAFLTFMLPESCDRLNRPTLKKFLLELLEDDNLYTSILKVEGSCSNEEGLKNPRVAATFPMDWCTHIHKKAQTKDGIKDSDEDRIRHIDPDCAWMVRYFRTHAKVMETVRPLIVHVLAKSWAEEDLPGLVEEAAVRAGMDRIHESEDDTTRDIMERMWGM